MLGPAKRGKFDNMFVPAGNMLDGVLQGPVGALSDVSGLHHGVGRLRGVALCQVGSWLIGKSGSMRNEPKAPTPCRWMLLELVKSCVR